ncbi:MAG: hypothetical protein Q4C91_23150, partial [Eubacteriales bacterium]|nr:hypothetical protein [Eubacteriales bacterium]
MKSPFKCTSLHLHIDTPIRKHHAEEIPKDIHDRNAFFLSGITLEKQAANVESFRYYSREGGRHFRFNFAR